VATSRVGRKECQKRSPEAEGINKIRPVKSEKGLGKKKMGRDVSNGGKHVTQVKAWGEMQLREIFQLRSAVKRKG